MNSESGRSVVSALCAGIIFCLAATATPAQDYRRLYPEGSVEAVDVFLDIAVARNEIPQDVLLKAEAIGYFKGVLNPASVGGYRQGNGAITVRTLNGWSAPVFYRMSGGDFGPQADAFPTDYLLVFTSRESIRDLAIGEFDLNLNANAVAGPSFGAEWTTREIPKPKTVFVYSRGKGLFAGAVIDDAKLVARDSANRDLYGINALALLSDPSQLPNMCDACLSSNLSDFPQTVSAAVPNMQPGYGEAAQPQTMMPQRPALYPPALRRRKRGVKTIVVKIIDDDDDDGDEVEILEVRDCPQPVQVINSCPRAYKKKL